MFGRSVTKASASMVVLLATAFATCSSVGAGTFADQIGAYLPGPSGCRVDTLPPDYNLQGVCIPAMVFFDEEKKKLIFIAIAELTNPDEIETQLQLLMESKRPIEAFEVEVDSIDGRDVILKDGSVIKIEDSYGLRPQTSILFEYSGDGWRLCNNGYEKRGEIAERRSQSLGGLRLSLTLDEIRKRPEC